jgi:hypothetical protein
MVVRRQREKKGLKPSTTFKDMSTGTYFFQVCLCPKVSTTSKIAPPAENQPFNTQACGGHSIFKT